MNPNFLWGDWQPVRGEIDGEVAPDEALRVMQLQLSATFYRVTFGGEMCDEGSCVTHSQADPCELLLHGKKGVNAGKEIRAIAQVRGDRLRICYGLIGQMPSDFSTSVGSQRYLVSYRRVHSVPS